MIISFLKKHFPAIRNPVLPAKVLFKIRMVFRTFGKFPREDHQHHILIVKLDEIGDVVFVSGLLGELRRTYPQSKITLAVNPTVYNLVEYCPYVDEVLTFEPLRVNYKVQDLFTALKFFRKFLLFLFRTLKFSQRFLLPKQFDLALLPRWDIDHMFSSVVIFFSNAKVRVAYSEHVNRTKAVKNHNSDSYFTKLLGDTELRHEVEHILNMGREIGITVQNENLELWNTREDDQYVSGFLQQNSVDDQDRLVVCCPGAGALKRRWPIERFGIVCSWIIQQYRVKVVVVGSNEERELGNRLQHVCGNDIINAVGTLSLRQTGLLMRRCLLYVGNDTGIMHMAAAVKLPVVEISCHPKSGDEFHPNSPKRFGPWRTQSIILQPNTPLSPCVQWCDAEGPHCITAVQVDKVQQAIRDLLHVPAHPS